MSPILFIPLIYVAAVVQTWFSPSWQVLEAVPNLLALVAFLWLPQCPSRRGLLMAALAGLVSDLNSSLALGVGMGAFACVAYSVVWLRQRISLDSFGAQLGVVWFGAAAVTFCQGVFIKWSGAAPVPIHLLVERSALVGLYTMIVAVPISIFFLVRRSSEPQFA
jgi:rod shape-determining protein MreD